MKIAIASGKGGTGKTTLSTNLAAFLAQKQEVVLVDLDVEEPNSGLFIEANELHREDKFKMIPEWKADNCLLCGTCQQVCNFHAVIKLSDQIMIFPELCHSCYACSELCPSQALPMQPQKMGELKEFSKENLTFIESRLDLGQEQAVPLIHQTNAYLKEYFNGKIFTILDAPPGTSCPVIEATKDADFVILVTEPTPFGLHDLTLAVETMRKLQKPFAVVINRDGIGDERVVEYCQNEEIPILAKIKNDRKIAELYAQGALLFDKIPQLQQALEQIVSEIQNQTGAKIQ